MTSKISYFDGAIFRRSLRRTMPLWLCYLLLWLIFLPGSLLSFNYQPEHYGSLNGTLCSLVLNTTIAGACLAALIALASAWILFSWLFHTNNAYFYASLPVRREALFLTNFLTGILMVTLANLLIALLTFLVLLLHGYPQLYACACFFGASTLSFLGFFGFAVLLSIIIGQIAAMPAVYAILNFTSVVLYTTLRSQLSLFVYGMDIWWYDGTRNTIFNKLSPVYYLITDGITTAPALLPDGVTYDEAHYVMYGWRYLIVFAIVGLVFSLLALWVFRRREMERSGDVIAVKPLRPVFLYCFAIGSGIVLGDLLSSLQTTTQFGAAAFWRTLLFMVLGAAIGYFCAQMMLKKTVAVFRGLKTWLGFGAVCLVLVLGCTLERLDVFGAHSGIPDIDDISRVELTYAGSAQDEADIEAFTQFHRLLIERRKENEEALKTNDWTSATFAYYLKDGTCITRRYPIAIGDAQRQDPDSLICRFDALINSPSMVLKRNAIPEELCPDAASFAYCYVEAYEKSDDGTAPETRYLSSQEAYTFYTTCILPDLCDTELGYDHPVYLNDDQGYGALAVVTFHIDPSEEARSRLSEKYDGPYSYSTAYDYRITKDARRSVAFLEQLGYSFD